MAGEYYKIGDRECRISMLPEVYKFCSGKKRIYIYGAGLYGRFIEKELKLKGIFIESYIVTDDDRLRQTGDEVDGKRVITLNQLFQTGVKSDIGIIICSGGGYEEEMVKNLENFGVKNYLVLHVDFNRPAVHETPGDFCYEDCVSEYKDGLFRLRITNRCPGKCDFCGQKAWSKEDQMMEMDARWYFDYLRPLYSKLKIMLITGGDSFYAKESYRFMEMISREYPYITISTESIGLTFDHRFQKMACDNLFKTHFSLNASNSDVFCRGCWSSAGGEKAYKKCVQNIDEYLELLEKEGKMCFAPSVSMVINQNTADDILDFIRMALTKRFSNITFYFDYRENDMTEDYFSNPMIGRKALRILMEVEKVLLGKVHIGYRLWVPLKELSLMEMEMVDTNIEELCIKYKDILELATKRDLKKEHQERNRIRQENQKGVMSLEEDMHATLRLCTENGINTCWAPWHLLDLYPNGRLDFCSWHKPTIYFQDYIENDHVDIDKIINSREFKIYRANMLNRDFQGCMLCCPMIRKIKSEK